MFHEFSVKFRLNNGQKITLTLKCQTNDKCHWTAGYRNFSYIATCICGQVSPTAVEHDLYDVSKNSNKRKLATSPLPNVSLNYIVCSHMFEV